MNWEKEAQMLMDLHQSHSWNTYGETTYASNSEVHQITMDMNHYYPEEINVELSGRSVVVTGQHGERQELFCIAARQFKKTYEIPDNADLDYARCEITQDRYLVITVPLRDTMSATSRVLPIIQTNTTLLRPDDGPSSTASLGRTLNLINNFKRPDVVPRANMPRRRADVPPHIEVVQRAELPPQADAPRSANVPAPADPNHTDTDDIMIVNIVPQPEAM